MAIAQCLESAGNAAAVKRQLQLRHPRKERRIGAFLGKAAWIVAHIIDHCAKLPISEEDRIIEATDMITIDLSPQNNCIWGDYARTLIVENGRIVKDIEQIQNNEWRDGIKMEAYLHEAMLGFVNENTTFEELFYYINDQIKARGYVNLDFLGNLGHSIVKDKRQRIYIEKGNTEKLSAVEAFTFEPHISLPGSLYGFKKENIYGFNGGVLTEL